MFWREIWDFIKHNIFAIVLILTAVVAAPWSVVFVFPIAILSFVIWRIRRIQHNLYEEARRQRGDEQFEQQESKRSWWRRTKNEGEVTVVQTEPTEQRVSDDVGEYVDFKEVKNEENK